MSQSDHMTSAEIERDVEQTRAHLAGTLDELRERLSPGRMLDEALTLARDSGGADFTRNIGRQVRDNPLPVLLIGAGIAWLIAGRGGPSSSRLGHLAKDARRRLPAPQSWGTDEVARKMSEGSQEIGFENRSFQDQSHSSGTRGGTHRLASLAGSVTDTAGGAIRSARDGARSAAGALSSGVSGLSSAASGAASLAADAYDAAGHLVSDARSGLSSAAGSVRHGSRDAARFARRGARSTQKGMVQMIEEQPLVVGALGIALGALIGAALPSTRREDAWMGEQADQAREMIGDGARHGASAAVDLVENTYDAAKAEAKAQGLNPSAVKEGLRDLGERATTVIHTAAETAKDELGVATGAAAGEHGHKQDASPNSPATPGLNGASTIGDPAMDPSNKPPVPTL